MLAHLADVSIRSLLLALLAAVVLRILRSTRTAALQHPVWAAVVCGMLALFAFGQALPRFSLRVPGSSPAFGRAVSQHAVNPAPRNAAPAAARLEIPPGGPAQTRRWIDWSEAAVYAYAAVALAFLARFATGLFLMRRLLAKSNAMRNFRESASISVPLTVGWLRPKIVLPLEWRAWDKAKLDAVLAHEGSHARRRDGLVAGLAALNRCIFWFHPLAWRLERRLSLLAEQACDESCVAALGDRERYARLLLEMARVVDERHGRLNSHALTMASRSHIRQRIESILQEGHTFSPGLSRTGWALVSLCAIPVVVVAGVIGLERRAPPLAVTQPAVPRGPVLLSQLRPTPPASSPVRLQFEVASVKPSVPRPTSANERGRSGGGGGGGGGMVCPESFKMDPGRVDIRCGHLSSLIAYAFRVPLGRVNGPDWMRDQRTPQFDIDARLPQGASEGQVPEMLQALLADRFQLATHRAALQQPLYALVVAKGGLRVTEAAADAGAPLVDAAADSNAPSATITEFGGVPTRETRSPNADGNGYTTTMSNPRIGTVRLTGGAGHTHRWEAPDTTFAGLADLLNGVYPLAQYVIDLTGLTGRYQVFFEVSLNDVFAAPPVTANAAGVPAAGGSAEMEMEDALMKAIDRGLLKVGLQLERRKGPVETLVVDHLEKTPTAN